MKKKSEQSAHKRKIMTELWKSFNDVYYPEKG